MAEPFIGEVKMVAFNFPPRNWAFCNGQTLTINQNQALFTLLGDFYGGDSRINFNLPDLRGRTPLGFGYSQYFRSSYSLGTKSGLQAVNITSSELPGHSHQVQARCDIDATPDPEIPLADQTTADGHMPASIALSQAAPFSDATSILKELAPSAVGPIGGDAAHNNIQPSLAVHFCISLKGIYPSRN